MIAASNSPIAKWASRNAPRDQGAFIPSEGDLPALCVTPVLQRTPYMARNSVVRRQNTPRLRRAIGGAHDGPRGVGEIEWAPRSGSPVDALLADHPAA